jgi:hypothetical protein
MTPEEERAVLDGRLQAALGEFDEMMMKEQQALEEKQREDPIPSRGSAGGPRGAGGPGERGADAGASGGPQGEAGMAGAEGSGGPGDTATGGSRDTGSPEEGAGPTSEVEGRPGGADPRVPPDVGDGSDDDVVARQLREAAMEEDDPELREKLWDEYREYKRSAGS